MQNIFYFRNYIYITILFLSLILPSYGFANECKEQSVKEAIQQCQASLNDVKGLLLLAKQEQRKAAFKALEAAEPGYKCVMGAKETLQDAVLYCNPQNPVTLNPVLCANTVLGIPDVYQDCKQAIQLLNESYAIYQRAKSVIGNAGIAFSDQGGDEVMTFLESCEYLECKEKKIRADVYIRETKQEIDQQIQQVERTRDQLQAITHELKKCEDNSSDCTSESDFNVEFPEGQGDAVPELILHKR